MYYKIDYWKWTCEQKNNLLIIWELRKVNIQSHMGLMGQRCSPRRVNPMKPREYFFLGPSMNERQMFLQTNEMLTKVVSFTSYLTKIEWILSLFDEMNVMKNTKFDRESQFLRENWGWMYNLKWNYN